LKIIKGQIVHIDACLNIVKQLPQYFTPKAIATMTSELRDHTLYLAIDSDEVLGFISYFNKTELAAELSWLAVKPAHQHQGIGSALVEYMVKNLKSQRIKLLEAKTLAEDADFSPYEITRKFYEKLGFIHLETIDPYPGWDPGNPCAIYVLIL
jgi:GNAT superfamily N-acetyltransferase